MSQWQTELLGRFGQKGVNDVERKIGLWNVHVEAHGLNRYSSKAASKKSVMTVTQLSEINHDTAGRVDQKSLRGTTWNDKVDDKGVVGIARTVASHI